MRLSQIAPDSMVESAYIIKRLHQEIGGSPDEVRSAYYDMSPYSYTDTRQYAIQPLISLPIRLYTEPDIDWWIEDGSDMSTMNTYDFAAMTNELKRKGNTQVELILTENLGYRKPDNNRHPHSWSIVNSHELVEWLLKHN